MGMETGMGLADRKLDGNGIVVYKKFPLVMLTALFFFNGLAVSS